MITPYHLQSLLTLTDYNLGTCVQEAVSSTSRNCREQRTGTYPFFLYPSLGPMHVPVHVHKSECGSENKTNVHMPIPPPPPPPPHPTHTPYTRMPTQRTIKLGMYLSLFINPILALVSMCFSFVRNSPAVSTLALVFFYPIGIASFIVRIIFYIKHSMCTCTVNNHVFLRDVMLR